ncbi:P-loop containing nucleoside triphosphate hydrolase protein [Rhypophila sp. PSN 637]
MPINSQFAIMAEKTTIKGPKIIVAGLPRTSTTSLKKGLEVLGIGPCFHLGDPPAPIRRVKESAHVLAIKDTALRRHRLKQLYDGYEAVFEPPASTLVDDMLAIYPDAKVILSVRKDPNVWLASYKGLGMDLRSRAYRWSGYWVPGVVHSSDLISAWAAFYEKKFHMAAKDVPSVELYHRHNAWVREIVPAGQLLEFQPSMGWGPLCEFLGREPPAEGTPFPWVNEAAFLRNVIRTAMAVGAVIWVVIFGTAWVLFLQLQQRWIA